MGRAGPSLKRCFSNSALEGIVCTLHIVITRQVGILTYRQVQSKLVRASTLSRIQLLSTTLDNRTSVFVSLSKRGVRRHHLALHDARQSSSNSASCAFQTTAPLPPSPPNSACMYDFKSISVQFDFGVQFRMS